MIQAVREIFVRPFQATGWTDLRIGFCLSLTSSGADDAGNPTTNLAETISAGGTLLSINDRVRIGVVSSVTSKLFLGYTNAGNLRRNYSLGDSGLVSSDIGIGTSNSDYWRPKNSVNDAYALSIIDGDNEIRNAADGSQLHLVQNYTGGHAAGYSTVVALRLTRDNPDGRAKIITMSVKKATAGGHSSDILFTSTPDLATLQANLESFPTNVQTLGPVELSEVPDTLYMYWPFHNSRLRVHAHGIVKIAG